MLIIKGKNGHNFGKYHLYIDFIPKPIKIKRRTKLKKMKGTLIFKQINKFKPQLSKPSIKMKAILKINDFKSLFIVQSVLVINYIYVIQFNKLSFELFLISQLILINLLGIYRMDMVRGLNGNDWDDENENKKKQQNNQVNKEQQEKMKKNVEEAIKEEKKNEQFNEIK